MYLQLDKNNRVLGLSESEHQLFPVEYVGEVPEDYDNYLFVDGAFVFDEREQNKQAREANESEAKRQENINSIPAIAEQLEEIKPTVELLKSVLREEYTDSDKRGYKFRNVYMGEALIVSEYVKDPTATGKADGSYINPYFYYVGEEVEKDKWYTDESGNVWLAIASGTPENFEDRNYFDIIE